MIIMSNSEYIITVLQLTLENLECWNLELVTVPRTEYHTGKRESRFEFISISGREKVRRKTSVQVSTRYSRSYRCIINKVNTQIQYSLQVVSLFPN